jgi:leucyl aminopeptidase
MKINLINKTIKEIDADLEIRIVFDKKNIKDDKKILENLNFEAKDEEVVYLCESNKIYVGCEEDEHDSIRIAISAAIKKLNATKFLSAKVELVGNDESANVQAIVEGALLGSYSFNKYKSKKEKKEKKTLFISVTKNFKSLDKLVQNAITVSKAVNKTRDMVNTIPADFFPETMANEAKELASKYGLKCKVYDEEYLKQNGMNSMYSVGIASIHQSQLIHLTHKPKNAKKKIVLVGKGLTYDSGGLSLKPADYMVTMKSDKGGGCAVLGIMQAVAKLDLPLEVHGIVGAVENMIGGDAFKPDDVLVAKNGKTIEVRNTDAEGRLVLADCLCYAQDTIKDIDYIFDYATLTGACMVGVGEYTTGLMGHNSKIKYQLVKSAIEAGEYATTLQFNRYLKKTIKSEIADVCNIASTRYGGAITAGLFLDNFINDEYKDKWVHHDIAGPAFVEKAWGYNPHGASGAGVRYTVKFLQGLL